MKSFINAAQAQCLKTYEGGEFAHLLEQPSEETFMKACKECGDTLLVFLMIELSAAEGCDSETEAASRLDKAIEQLQAVRNSLEAP